jgi:putative transposase
MARPLRLEYEGAIYHVMARGNERGAIFKLNSDRLRFLEKLGESARTYHVRVYAYALMKNHWHGLIETPRGNISAFMQQFNTSYTTYYNTKHQRVGHLYSGRYKAPVVEGDDYLRRLSRYIHLNPVQISAFDELTRDEKVGRLHAYRWSSFRAYAGMVPRLDWMDYEPLLALVAANAQCRSAAYGQFVESGINADDDVLAEAMGWSSKAVGTRAFCRQVELDLKAQVGQLGSPQDAAMRRMETGTQPETVETAVCTVCRVTRDELYGRRRKSDARAILMKLLIEYSGMTQRAVAHHLGLTDGSGVSRVIAQLNRDLARNKRLARLLRKAEVSIAKH